MKKEAQVSIETMASISVMLLIFVLAISFVYLKRSELLSTERYLEKRKECNSIANAITEAKVLGDGTETVVFANSNVSIFNRSMLIAVRDFREIAYCSIEKVRIGNYTNISGRLLIRNKNGLINITRT